MQLCVCGQQRALYKSRSMIYLIGLDEVPLLAGSFGHIDTKKGKVGTIMSKEVVANTQPTCSFLSDRGDAGKSLLDLGNGTRVYWSMRHNSSQVR